MQAAHAFLLERQRADGSWWEWRLPPGASGAWTTAYVAARLLDDADGLEARQAAARWLVGHECDGGGWGYNERTGADADSTAHALLLLARAGWPAPASGIARLRGFQRADGGFSTFGHDLGMGAWGRSHPDVTPVALLALTTVAGRDDPAVARGLEYILRERRPDGLWNAYWWHTPLYSARACLAVLREAGRPPDVAGMQRALRAATPVGAFERALLLECLCETEADGVGAIAGDLEAAALADGSLPSEPILRVPPRSCPRSWECPSAGMTYSDPGRLFTTATALNALRRARGR